MVVFEEGKASASSFCCFQAESTVHYGGGQRKRLGCMNDKGRTAVVDYPSIRNRDISIIGNYDRVE